MTKSVPPDSEPPPAPDTSGTKYLPSEYTLLTAPQMANRLRITRRHLDSLASKKIIPKISLGRSVRFDPADVIAALKAQGDSPKPE